LLSQLFKLFFVLPEILTLIAAIVPIVIISEPRAVGAISVAASKLMQIPILLSSSIPPFCF